MRPLLAVLALAACTPDGILHTKDQRMLGTWQLVDLRVVDRRTLQEWDWKDVQLDGPVTLTFDRHTFAFQAHGQVKLAGRGPLSAGDGLYEYETTNSLFLRGAGELLPPTRWILGDDGAGHIALSTYLYDESIGRNTIEVMYAWGVKPGEPPPRLP